MTLPLRPGSADELSSLTNQRAIAAEFIATFFFVFLGAGTVVSLAGVFGRADGGVLVGIALAHGLAIALLVTATANISGGHINPAVTFAAVLTGRMSAYLGVAYAVAQIAGGVVAAIALKIIFPEAAEDAVNLGAHALNEDLNGGQGLLTEILLTGALVFVVFATAMDPRGRADLAPAAIGLTVLVDHLIGIPLTGASMNPARSFGPSLIANFWDDQWLYWIGPLAGGAAAALVYHFVFMPQTEQETRT